MNKETFGQVRQTLVTLPQAIEKQMDEYKNIPLENSQADRERGHYPGSETAFTAHSLGALALIIAADHMSALEQTLTEPVNTFAPWALGRAVLESASLAMWLLDVNLDVQTRVARGMTIRLQQLEDWKIFVNSNPSAPLAVANTTGTTQPPIDQSIATLVAQARQLGITEKRTRNGRLIGFGSGLPTATHLAQQTFGDGWVYRMLSASTHGRFWAAWALSLQLVDGGKSVESNLDPEAALWLVVKAIDWFTRPTWHYFQLYDWDLSRLASALETQYDQAKLNQATRFWHST